MTERHFILSRNEPTKKAAVALSKRFKTCGVQYVTYERYDQECWHVEGIATLNQLQKFAMDELCREAK